MIAELTKEVDAEDTAKIDKLRTAANQIGSDEIKVLFFERVEKLLNRILQDRNELIMSEERKTQNRLL